MDGYMDGWMDEVAMLIDVSRQVHSQMDGCTGIGEEKREANLRIGEASIYPFHGTS